MKVVITARNFNFEGCDALKMLKDAGLEVEYYGENTFENDNDRIELMRDADIVIPAIETMDEKVFEKCPKIKAISLRGIGYDNIDVDYCREHDIKVLRSVGSLEGSVAEQVMAYIMYFARKIDLQNDYMQNAQWNRIMTSGVEDMTLGLVGFGGIGKEIAKRATAFGMNVVYYCRHPKPEWDNEYGVEYMPLDELLAISDYTSINTPLTSETKNMFNAETISKMKQGSVLINIARSLIVDNEALASAVKSGKLGGAAVDVYESEPCTDSVLKGIDNIVLTPHTSPFTKNTFIRMNNLTAQNAIDYFNNDIKDMYLLK